MIDIIVPVWNRPVETRACLSNLIEHTLDARLVLVDNGSDRETERMLEEFAEALDVKVLFIKNRLNEGFVRAVNRGLARSNAPLLGIVRQNSIVQPGWIDPLLACSQTSPDAGIIAPSIHDTAAKRSSRVSSYPMGVIEMAHADFAAVLLRRGLVEDIGEFNEGMDGGVWCLKEYSRRAWKAGYRTCMAPGSCVVRGEEITFGSASRRREHEQNIRAIFSGRWGEERNFCIHLPKGTDLEQFREKFDLVMAAARQGSRITLLHHASLSGELDSAGYGRLHLDVTLLPLSRFMPDRSARNVFASLADNGTMSTAVSWDVGTPFPSGIDAITFSEMERMVREKEMNIFGRPLLAHDNDGGG
jgi:GT2 family glycosyltransferase